MTIATGTATNYHDLLDKLRIFCSTTLGWTVLRWTPPSGGLTAVAELVVRPIGTGAFRPVITFKTLSDVPNGFYHWLISGAEDFDTLAAQFGQPNSSPGFYVPYASTSMTYWFYGNDRRIIVVAKAGTSYSSLYAGLFLPFAFPTEYRRPLYIAGSSSTQEAINSTNTGSSFFIDPGVGNASMMNRDDIWVSVQNKSRTTAAEPAGVFAGTTTAFVWPKKVQPGSAATSSGDGSWAFYAEENMRPNASGEMLMTQAHIFSPFENAAQGGISGALDGCFATPGFGRTPEQLVSFGGSSYRLFPNMARTGNTHYMAIEEY